MQTRCAQINTITINKAKTAKSRDRNKFFRNMGACWLGRSTRNLETLPKCFAPQLLELALWRSCHPSLETISSLTWSWRFVSPVLGRSTFPHLLAGRAHMALAAIRRNWRSTPTLAAIGRPTHSVDALLYPETAEHGATNLCCMLFCIF